MDSGELLAVKRVGQVRSSSTIPLTFFTPEDLGRRIYTVYLINDAYLGMDQQYNVPLEIIESDISSQVNTEVNFECWIFVGRNLKYAVQTAIRISANLGTHAQFEFTETRAIGPIRILSIGLELACNRD